MNINYDAPPLDSNESEPKSGITLQYNTTSYNHVFKLFIEPYIPYLVDITAATIIGKGEISQKTFLH